MEAKCWYIFDGRRWVRDNGGCVMELSKEFAKSLIYYAKSLVGTLDPMETTTKDTEDVEDENDGAGNKIENFPDYVNDFHKRSRRISLIADASSIAPKSLNEFDQKPLLFNCLNGTLDLQSITFRKHNPKDFITKIANVKYDEDAVCDRWLKFIDEVMCGYEENACFMQKSLGYSLSGLTIHECFFILYGASTRNGKSTLTETISELFDEYAMTIQPQTLAKRSTNGSAPSPDIAKLKGARFVNVPEPTKGMNLDAAFVKQLTGGDAVSGRLLFQNPIQFRPEFKIFMNTNHKLTISDDTISTSDRIKVIPFERHFSPEQQDRSLKMELRKPENLSGILNWLIDGYRMMQIEGLNITEKIAVATKEYQNDMSFDLEDFFNQNLVKSDTEHTKTSDLYKRYSDCIKK